MPARPRRNNDDGSSPSSSGSSGSSHLPRTGKHYVVERIIDERVKCGKRQFCVRWKGYSSVYDSWEDERDCNCPILIAAFRRQRDRDEARALKLDKEQKKKWRPERDVPLPADQDDEEDDLGGFIVPDGQGSEDLAADDREMDDDSDDDDDDDDYDYEGEEEEEKDERKTRTSPRKRAPKRTPQSRRVTRRSARMKNDTGLDESDVSDVDAQENDVDDNDVEEVEVDEAVTPRTRRSRRSQKSEESCSQDMSVRKKRRRSKKIDSDEEEEKEEEKEEDGKQEKSQENDGKQEKSQEDNSQMVSPMRTKRGRMIKVDIDEDDELYEDIEPQMLEDSPDDWEEMALEVLKRLNNAATFEEVESYEANVWSPNADVPRTPRNIVGVRRLFEKVSYIENGPSTSSAVNPLKYDLVSSSMLRQIAPNLLVDYYESALVFRES